MSYQFNTGCSLNNLKGIRDFVRKALDQEGVDEITKGEIVLALDEMCSNLMIHAHHCNPDDFLGIHITRGDRQHIIFEIIDRGNVFDINQFQTPELDNLIHQKRKGGLGIRLVKSIMDDVEYLSRDGNTVCRLTKKV